MSISTTLRRVLGAAVSTASLTGGLAAVAPTAAHASEYSCTLAFQPDTIRPGESTDVELATNAFELPGLMTWDGGSLPDAGRPTPWSADWAWFDAISAGSDAVTWNLYEPGVNPLAPGENAPLCSATVHLLPAALADQTIDFPALPDVVLGSGLVTPAASVASGLPIFYHTADEVAPEDEQVCRLLAPLQPNASVEPARIGLPTQVELLKPGTCTVIAYQFGDDTHRAATPVARSFEVRAPAPVVVPAPPVSNPAPQPSPVPALPKHGVTAQVVKVLGHAERGSKVHAGPVAVCRARGAGVVLVAPGTCRIRVTRAGATVRTAKVRVGYPAKAATTAGRLTRGATAYFSFDSAVLSPEAKKALRGRLAMLRRAKLVVVYGNTYGPGRNSAHSREVAGARAEAVVRFLAAHGVKARAVTVAAAMENPVSDTPAKNRRADVYYRA